MRFPIAEPVRAEVERRLSALEADGSARILLAVESGSRAWGFPSPDSDYDVRLIYLRPRDQYLALTPCRDVIEQPIVDDIDLAGWDLRKAVGLMLKSNATVAEWLSSPIRYRPDDPAMDRLRGLVERSFNPRGVAQHYANLGRSAVQRWTEGDADVPVKRYFYALRPALAIRALRLNPDRLPPMNLQELVEASDLPDGMGELIEQLVERKSRTRELDAGCREPVLDRLIADELPRADELPERRITDDERRDANQFFLDLVNT